LQVFHWNSAKSKDCPNKKRVKSSLSKSSGTARTTQRLDPPPGDTSQTSLVWTSDHTCVPFHAKCFRIDRAAE
jgi:hypothetical protein